MENCTKHETKKIKKEARKLHSTKQMSSLVINNTNLMGLENMATAFNNFFLSVTENLNLHQVWKEDATLFLQGSFS